MRHNPRVLGLDIGRVSIKAVQVTTTPKGPRLDGALCLRRQGLGGALSRGEAARLTKALQRRGTRPSRVVLVAPSESLVSGSVAVPPPTADLSRDKIVQAELGRAHRLPTGGFEFAWWDLPTSPSGTRVSQAHAVALSHTAIAPALSALSEAGLEVSRTVPMSLAVLAAAQRRPIDPRRIIAVVDLGSVEARLVLMHAGRVVHERPLPDFNPGAIREQLCLTLGIDPAAATHALGHYGLRDEPDGQVACESTAVLSDAMALLTEEIGMSFAFVSHLYPEAELGPVLLAGGAANIPGLANAIAGVLELETAVITPASLLGGECFGTESADPALTAAAGAALMEGGQP